jgi:hypothetical protein
MDLFFNVDGVGTETGFETAGCVVSVEEDAAPRVLVTGAEVVVAAVVVAVEAKPLYQYMFNKKLSLVYLQIFVQIHQILPRKELS